MIVKLSLSLLLATALVGPATAQSPGGNRGDDTLVEMSQAFRAGDKRRLTQLLPLARGHTLEPWAAYWELKARLDEALPQEVQSFLTRYAGTYQEDRLRNDWLLLLGQRRDWDGFLTELARFRMNDDREVRCYQIGIDQIRGTPLPQATVDELRRNWFAARDGDDGCTLTAARLYDAKRLTATDVWKKARLAMELGRTRSARAAVEIVAPEASTQFAAMANNVAKFLVGSAPGSGTVRRELITLALVRMANNDPDMAASLLEGRWSGQLNAEERNWVWGVAGKQAALKLSSSALDYYAKVTRDADLTDEMLAWKARAALRAGSQPQWRTVLATINEMDADTRRDSTWVYWKARALLATAPPRAAEGRGDPPAPAVSGADTGASDAAPTPAPEAPRIHPQRAEGLLLLDSIASPRGFYEQLALEETGRKIVLPAKPPAPTAEEKALVRGIPGIQRALYAIAIGLRSEGVREWNYQTNLVSPSGKPGPMNERELLAAAQLACERQVWDRCINTSERTKNEFDVDQRFPMPYRDAVVKRSREIGLDPAYVYGLIRQESRFVMDARSGVGASGLMQVMPATARWTAKKIGMTGFTADQITDRDTNIAIGTGYLKLVLDDFGGSMPLAAAAYNAGPGRPRVWRGQPGAPVLDGAVWAENVPFGETRDYVKKVLSNTNFYATILSGQPQSLRARLGMVGPRGANDPEPNTSLP